MSRRFSQLEGPSPDELAFAAPLFTPLFALTGLPFNLSAPFTWFDFALVSPLVAIVSVAFGYIGLLFICIPVMALLYWTHTLDAVRLCFSPHCWVAGYGLPGSFLEVHSRPSRRMCCRSCSLVAGAALV